MDRTNDAYETELRYGEQTFVARKQDMNAVNEVLVNGAYDYMIPFLGKLDHAPVVLDCGANIGSFGLRLLKERPDARIVSVEAAPDTYAVLKKNCELNAADWRAVHAALWKFDGRLVLHRDGSSERHSVREATDRIVETVPARTLESIREELGLDRIDLLKMDIEGAEAVVIPASSEAVDAGRMIIELHKNHSAPTRCCEILVKMYPHALVETEHLNDKLHPNIVYYFSREPVEMTGMVSVDVLEHLDRVYDPKDWN